MKKFSGIGRYIVCCLLLFAVFGVYVMRLFQWQIIDGDSYYSLANTTTSSYIKLTATRGEILDRNGELLAQNRTCYNIVFDDTLIDREKLNDTILELIGIMEETDRIIRAQKARGADFESGNIFKRAKAFIPILIPMFIGAFKRAEELAVAMDARCYKGAKGRTKMKILKCGWRDAVGAVVLVLFFAAVITLNYLEPALSASLPWMFFGA